MTRTAGRNKLIVAGNAKNPPKKNAAKKPTIKKASLKKAASTVIRKASSKQKTNYLTKRILVSAAASGFEKASKKTMIVMGENIIVKDGWVIRIFADGRIEKIKELEKNNKNHIALD